MDFKDLANKAKDALGKNPNIIDKAGDFIDGKTLSLIHIYAADDTLRV